MRTASKALERVKGIEPSSQPWEGHILPLNHTRVFAPSTCSRVLIVMQLFSLDC